MKQKQINSNLSLSEMNIKFETLWQDLPPEVQALAFEFRAFTRARRIKTVEQLLQMVLLYCGLDCSLKTTSGTLCNLGRSISDQGVCERLKGCVPWLTAVLRVLLPEVPTPELSKAGSSIKRLLIIDGSSVQSPGTRQLDYRIHLAWDWLTQSIVDLQVTGAQTGESLQLYHWAAGDVALADRGYSRATDICHVLDQQAEVIVRLAPQGIPLVDETEALIDVAAQLAGQTCLVSQKVVMKADPNKRPMYLHAFEIPAEKADQIRLKKRKKAQKEGRTIKKETLIYAGWTLILTSFTPEQLTTRTISEMYRLRWQIEIVIKRLKSVLQLDRLRARRGGLLATAYLLGKCIYILIVEKLASRLKGAKEVAWRVWQMVKEQIRPLITESADWQWRTETMKNLTERRRRRVRQSKKLSAILSKL
jgi:DDE family transposase